jgi:predicted enzyme related to lactoylglutathione lyase
MAKVISIGGVFFKSKDPKALNEWYQKHLGIQNEGWGAQFLVDTLQKEVKNAYQLLSTFKSDSTYFSPSEQSFMINFIVDDVAALLKQLRSEGVEVMEKTEEGEYGKFGWCMDPDGNKIELWEPPKA